MLPGLGYLTAPRQQMTHLGSGGCIAAIEDMNGDFCSGEEQISAKQRITPKDSTFARLVQPVYADNWDRLVSRV
jgi:hypothetical protein